MTDAGQPDDRYALIVANSDYRDPKLRTLRSPAADAKRLAKVLADPEIGGYEVELALDEEQPQLTRRLTRFFSNRRPDDLLLVHFSCHGVKDQAGELYLAAKDTEIGYMLGATGISSAWLRQQIDRSRSRRIVVLLDCCYSGSAPFGMRSRAGEDVNVKDHLQGRGRAVITASNATEYSYEGNQLSGEGQPSIFTDAVLQALESGMADRDGDRWISFDELYDYVYDRVKDRTPNQHPTKLSTLEGPFHVARSVYEAPIEPAELDQRLLELVEHPVAGGRLGAIDELARLLSSPNKGVALGAKLTLERMIDDDSRRVAERAHGILAMLAPEQQQASHQAEDNARRETDGGKSQGNVAGTGPNSTVAEPPASLAASASEAGAMTPAFSSDVQLEVYEMVADYLTMLERDHIKHDTVPVLEVVNQDAPNVSLSVQPLGSSGSCFVLATAWLLQKPTLTAELMRYLLEHNEKWVFGKFSIDADGDLSFKHAMSAGLALEELGLVINILADVGATETLTIMANFRDSGSKFGTWKR